MGLIINALRHPALISYLSGANNYSVIHFRNGEQLMISKSLRYLEGQLPQFIRIHKTVLVNPNCVRKVQNQPHPKTSGAVILEDGKVLPVSRRQWQVLAESIWTDKSPAIEPERSIAFVSSDVTKSLLLRQLFSDHWPLTLLHVIETGTFISQLLSFAEADRPALLLLDLRQATPSRLALLNELKETPRLRRLPVVLLTGPNNAVFRSAHIAEANSVVMVPDDNSQFVKLMEDVCRYWFTAVALPAV